MSMRMKSVLAAILLVASPLAANAVLVNYGTSEYVTFRDCFAGVTACDTISPIIAGAYGGSPGAASSAASLSLPGYGTGSGTVSLSGLIGAPFLLASAASEPGKRANTNSVALQSYTYTGAATTTRTFGGTFDYSQLLTLSGGDYGSGVGNGVRASLDIFTLSVPLIDVGDTPASNFAILSSPFALPGYASLGTDQFSDITSNAAGSGSIGVTVTLNPGDTIWVWVFLQTPAVDGSIINVVNGLTTRWDDPTGLIPAVSVPEPATLALLGLGLAGLVASRRRLR